LVLPPELDYENATSATLPSLRLCGCPGRSWRSGSTTHADAQVVVDALAVVGAGPAG
jgi:hypothetical protein